MPAGRRSLKTKLAIVACVYLTIVLAAVGMSALMIRSWDRALGARSAARVLAGDVTDLRLAYSDQETGLRGYRLSLDESFLEPYRSGRSVAFTMERRIRENGSAATAAALDEVEAAAAAWQHDVADVALDLSTPLPPDDVAKDRFDAVRASLDELDRVVSGELDRASQRVDRARRSTMAVLLGSALFAIGGTALITVLFRRWITEPLGAIVTASRQLIVDDNTPMPTFDSVELQEVGDAIGSLQLELRRERDRAIAAYRGLEQSAGLALHVRSELAEELGELPGGWIVASAHHAAEGVVAGDCYDVSLVDQRRFYVIMIDVTGHGATAALHALTAKTQLRSALRSRFEPGAALEWLSRQVQSDDRAELLTAFVALIDVENGTCRYANGGHPPPILGNGETLRTLDATGPLIGAFAATWDTRQIDIPLGATLTVYTDGVTEALGPGRERFGEERLTALLARADASAETDEPDHVVKLVVDEVDRFRSGEPRQDDLTMVVLQRGVGPRPEIVATVQP